MPTLTAAYVAGLVDGEGCIGVYRNKDHYLSMLVVGMSVKALPVLTQLQRQYGGSVNQARKATKNWSETRQWVVRNKAAATVLAEIESYLELKQEQARLVLKMEALREHVRTVHHRRWPAVALERAHTMYLLTKELNARGPEKTLPRCPEGYSPVAQLVAGQWVTFQEDYCSDTGWAPFRGTWPKSGTMRNGVVFQPLPWERVTSGSASSSSPSVVIAALMSGSPLKGTLPTPRATDGTKGSPNQRGSAGDLMLPSAVSELLPTPSAGRHNDGEDVDGWKARNERLREKYQDVPGGAGNGMGKPLTIAVQQMGLLPTPAARDGKGVNMWREGSDGLPAEVAKLDLLATPTAQLATNGGSQPPAKRRAGGHQPTLADQAEHDLLPTPTASVSADPAPWKPGVEWWLQSRAARSLAAVDNLLANGGGLLPTPTAQAAKHGEPAPSETRPQDGSNLWVVAGGLLPTPQAHDAATPKTADQVTQMRARGAERGHVPGVSNLNEVVPGLLPTPGAADYKGSGAAVGRDRGERARTAGDADLPEAAEALLPTPQVADVTGGHRSRSGDRSDEPLLPAIVEGLVLPTQTVDWGKYARAIARWEQIMGVVAPYPLVPGRGGKGRLSEKLVEWMMGVPPGWVTEVEGLSRNAKLKILGNGVVPQQAYLALHVLVARLVEEP